MLSRAAAILTIGGPNGKGIRSMGCMCPGGLSRTLLVSATLWLAVGAQRVATAQFLTPLSHFELSDTIRVDAADSTARTHLEQVKTFLADQQWDESIETLLGVMEGHGQRVVEVSDGRYLSVREYCHIQLAGLPPEALALYRGRVDAEAEKLYTLGIQTRDEALLSRVVERYFASHQGDNALLALGEIALGRGDFGSARDYWQQILPNPESKSGQPTRLAYPDSEIPPAAVHARLVLDSILSGDALEAEQELESFAERFPDAEGHLGGREVNYVAMLSALLKSSTQWPEATPPGSPLNTFAGTSQRTQTARQVGDVGRNEKWNVPLSPIQAGNTSVAMSFGMRPTRPAEDAKQLLSYHPVLAGQIVLICNRNAQNGYRDEIRAVDLDSGKPVWGLEDDVIFFDEHGQMRNSRMNNRLGVPRFTLTVHGDKLLARLGNSVTSQSNEFRGSHSSSGYIVCLDLKSQGKEVWRQEGDEKWAFEGTPITDGNRVYVAMRRGDVVPQAHVACFSLDTGEMIWRRFVCAAETPARGRRPECTHNLLTRQFNTLYYNTNLGAVAALGLDGSVKWISRYERAQGGNLHQQAAHFYRDLNPCIYYRGTILVAPSDSPKIVAYDAETGIKLWDSPHPEDVVHLLGVGSGNLVATGDRVWWINVRTGKVVAHWPDSLNTGPKGYGRGLLAGDEVFWPTRTKILVFDQATGKRRREIPLTTPVTPELTGGNLMVADDYLLIATGDRLVALERFPTRSAQRNVPPSLLKRSTLNQSAEAP
jgi:outer membrane protein assembly factor BamB